jgi:hypothetical protein
MSKECSICKKPIPAEGDWVHGHNAMPVNDGRCCGDCNKTIVIPARLGDFSEKERAELEQCIKSVRAWEAMIPEAEKAIIDVEVNRLYWPHPNVLEFLVIECGMGREFAREMLANLRSRN